MKFWALALGVTGIACAFWQPGRGSLRDVAVRSGGARRPKPASPPTALSLFTSPSQDTSATIVVFVSGDTDGYLSPCGCTKPMTGGIKRRATAIRALGAKGRTVVLDNGPLSGGIGRQNELKAETMAQALAAVGATAINFAPSDAQLGEGAALSMERLSNGRLISTSLQPSATNTIPATVRSTPFLIGGVAMTPQRLAVPLNEGAVTPQEAVGRLVADANEGGLVPIVLLQGSRDDARALAQKFPEVRLIVYRATGSPPSALESVGKTILVTPGERGKYVLRMTFQGGEFKTYVPVQLGPGFKDDPDVSRIYAEYLKRVTGERLLDAFPRTKTAAYAGSKACATCHPKDTTVWRHSLHVHALATLEKEGHGRDPDCVKCHVVALSSDSGFRSRALTPALSDVGCESCHGPSARHSAKPKTYRLPKVGPASCAACHTSEQSPSFDFRAYWKKIAH